jgi:heme-degrading monooxygenase HmoA
MIVEILRLRVRVWQAAFMVLEIALIDIRPGQEDAFAAAYAGARHLVASTPGCRSVRMTRGIESPSRFVLLVEWDSVEAHLENFRGSDRFPRWRGLIGEHFAGPPVVEHFTDMDSLADVEADA